MRETVDANSHFQRPWACIVLETQQEQPNSRFAPGSTVKSIELHRDGEPTPGLDTDECLNDIER
jgi:hypothetical protein